MSSFSEASTAAAAALAAMNAPQAVQVEAAPSVIPEPGTSGQVVPSDGARPISAPAAELLRNSGVPVADGTQTPAETAEGQAEAAAEPAPETPPEPIRPGVKAVQEYRREREELIRTNARLQAEQEATQQVIMPLLQQFQALKDEIAALRQGTVQPAAPAEPEFDDMGDPALRELYELKKELAETKSWRQKLEEERQFQAEATRIEREYETKWGTLRAQYPALQSKPAASAFWETVQQYPTLPLDMVAELIAARHPATSSQPGANRPGQPQAQTPATPNVPPRAAPPRPPPGGTAAAIPVATRPMTTEAASAAALQYLQKLQQR